MNDAPYFAGHQRRRGTRWSLHPDRHRRGRQHRQFHRFHGLPGPRQRCTDAARHPAGTPLPPTAGRPDGHRSQPPDPDWNGGTRFTVLRPPITRGAGNAPEATLTVTPVNDAPSPADDAPAAARGRAGSGTPDRHRRGRHIASFTVNARPPTAPEPRRRPDPTGHTGHPCCWPAPTAA